MVLGFSGATFIMTSFLRLFVTSSFQSELKKSSVYFMALSKESFDWFILCVILLKTSDFKI